MLNTQHKMSDTVLSEKYTSHFIDRVVCERDLETEQNCKILTPTLMAISVFFPVFLDCSTRGLRTHSAGCWISLPHLVTMGLVSKLTDSLSSPSDIIVPRPPSCWRHNRTHPTRSRSRLYSDIPWVDAPVIYTGAFPILTSPPGRRSI